MERVISILIELERRALAECRAHRPQLVEARQRVARALQEQHRDPHIGEMLAALARRFAGWVQREAEEREAAHAVERRIRLRLRGHAATEGFAAGDQR